MAKKQRPQGGEDAQAQLVQNRDILQRLNFLYQASAYLAHASPPDAARAPASTSRARNAARHRHTLSLHDLSRAYTQSMRAVGLRTVTRIDPTVKRTMCKGCASLLVPGTTARVRVLPSASHEHAVRTTCRACGASRTIPCPPRAPELSEEPAPGTGEQEPPAVSRRRKRLRVREPAKVPFFERPEHVVLRGRERLGKPPGNAMDVGED